MTRKVLQERGLLELAQTVALRHFVTVDMLLSRQRTKAVAAARSELCAELRGKGLSYPEIGQLLDRDHTTVIDAVRRHAQQPRRSHGAAA